MRKNQGKIQKLEVQAEGLAPWMSLSVPMNYEGTMQTAMMIGTVPGQRSSEDLYQLFAQNAPEVEAVDMEIISTDKDYTYLAVLCMKSDKSAGGRSAAGNRFCSSVRPSCPTAGRRMFIRR